MTRNHQPPGDADLDRVVGVFDALMHRLMASHAPELNALELTMAQAKVMYVVMAAGPLRMSELAARLGIGSSSASELADRLVELGLLQRNEEPDDRRQVVVSATPARGRAPGTLPRAQPAPAARAARPARCPTSSTSSSARSTSSTAAASRPTTAAPTIDRHRPGETQT